MSRLIAATHAQTAAILAAALIGATGRRFRIQEAIDLARDIHFSMQPAPGNRVYDDWKKTFNPELIIS
jgi:hypothetical protein